MNLEKPALRLAAAGLLAALALAAVAALLATSPQPGVTGSYHVLITGPDSDVWNGTVHVANATALKALEAAATAGQFSLQVRDYGAPCSTYVQGIAGHVAKDGGSAGWIYEVRDPGNPWIWADRSADCYPLATGQELRWRWSQQP